MVKVWLRPKPDTLDQYTKMINWCWDRNMYGHPKWHKDKSDTMHPGSWYLKEEDAVAFHLTFESLYYD